jgi:hypothetical protein
MFDVPASVAMLTVATRSVASIKRLTNRAFMFPPLSLFVFSAT